MSGQLKMDTSALRDAGSGLRAVAQEFDGANAATSALGTALGHAGLAARVEDFAHGWDDRRAEMVGAIAGLAEACTGIGEGFEELDAQFAAALLGEE